MPCAESLYGLSRWNCDRARMPYGELALVQHELENAAELVLVRDGQQSAFAPARRAHTGHVFRKVRTIVNEPLKPSLEIWQPIEHFGLQGFYSEQWNQSHHGTDLHGEL